MKKTQFFRIILAIALIFGLFTPSINNLSTVNAAGLVVSEATPRGNDASLDTVIEITFNQAIQPETFAATINTIPVVPSQVVMSIGNTVVSIDPGELEFGRQYDIVVSNQVKDVVNDTLGSDYPFNFTVVENSTSKRPTTTVVLPTGTFESNQTYTLSGQASGFVWVRDADNPLELRHWAVDGTDTGSSPMLHPTALYFPNGMDGYKFWLYYTPYPSEVDENPVLMRSNDGVNFVATGVTNPLFAYNFQPPYDTQNLADPEVYRVGNTWMLFYEQEAHPDDVLPYMGTGGNIGVAFSTDGKSWQPYGGAYTYDPSNHPISFPENGNPVVKPPTSTSTAYRSGEMAVIFKDGVYHMWRTVIDGGLFIYHDTASDPRGPWTLQADKITLASYEYGPHPDVIYDAERDIYLMIYLIPSGPNVGQLGLYTSNSPSGPWNLHPITPMFSAQSAWEGTRLYRASMVDVDGHLYMYYSGDSSGTPQIGLAREVPGVRRVEISTNGGSSWQLTSLNPDGSWSYNWTPSTNGDYSIMARVTDDFMLGESTSEQIVNVGIDSLPTPNSPILLVTNNNYSSNPYNEYLSEILLSEGLVSFQRVELSTLVSDSSPLTFLTNYELVLLAETSLTPIEEQMWRDFVSAGGKLISMRPDPDLDDLFGITYVSPRAEQLLQFLKYDTSSVPGTAIVDLSLQYHGEADNYSLNGAVALANLWTDISTPSSTPAVVENAYGNGLAAAYTFDLAKSIVLTRQGNPAWKDSEGDGLSGYRPGDLFFRTNGDKWLAPDRTRVPQADEQQRFLANLMIEMMDSPLPRMWYLPDGKKSLMVNTGDAESYAETQLDHTLNDAASYGGAFTSYLMDVGISGTSAAKEASWRAAGHETGPHVYGGGDDTCAALTPAYAAIVANLQAKFGHGARTARSHTIDWCGYVDMAEIEANNGTGLDVNYYHYLTQLLSYGDNANGYFTGSGLPQKFMSESGNILPIYQALTEWPDEWFDDNGFSANATVQIIKDMFTAAENGYYSAFVANIHHVRYDNIGGDITHDWANQIWEYAQNNGIPIWSAEMLLDFTTARNAAQFTDLNWNGTTLSYDFVAPISGQKLTQMVPARVGSSDLISINFAGAPVSFTTDTIKGVDYAFFTTQSSGGSVVVSYGEDIIAPNISNLQATNITDTSATISWNTDEPATSRVDYGFAVDSLNSSQQSAAFSTSHSLSLTGLNPDTVYFYKVSSIDRTDNSTVSLPTNFTTSLPRWVETSETDFSDGTLADIQVTSDGGGSLLLGLASGFYDHFLGTLLNETNWLSRNIIGNPINVSVSNSNVTVADGTYVRTNQTWFQETLEASVTLSDGPNSHFGWATTVQSGDDDIDDPHWMIFTAINGQILARTRLNDGLGTNEQIDTVLSGIPLGVPHNFKIVWNSDNTIEFWVDGYLQVTHTRAFTESMRVYLTSNASQSASADWVKVSGAYALSGIYTSSVFNSGGSTVFDALNWTGSKPSGTVVSIETRTSANLVDWSAWQPLGASGAIVSPEGQLFQYRVTLTTTDPAVSPRVEEIVVTYQLGPDESAPIIISTEPANLAIGVPFTQTIAIHYNEAIKPTTFSATLNDVDLTVAFQDSNRTATLDPIADLLPLTNYTLSIAAGVEDTYGNATSSANEINFTTADLFYTWVETTNSDFNDGSLSNVQVSNIGDGAVQLALTGFYDHFEGTSIDPAKWTTGDWQGGAIGVQVLDSVVTVNAMDFIKSISTFNQTMVEGNVRFGANGVSLNFAVGDTLNAPCTFMTIGPGGIAGAMRVETYDSGDPLYDSVTSLPAFDGIIGDGEFHYVKIEWTADQVSYYINDPNTPVASHTGFARPLDKDYNIMLSSGGVPLSADWISASGYAESGVYISNVFEAAENSLFQTLEWTGDLPMGTTVGFNTRTSVDGINWTDWQAVALNHSIVSPAGTYIQYRAFFSSSGSAITPTVEAVTITYAPQAPETIPPEVIIATPTGEGAPVDTNITITFSEPIKESSFSAKLNGIDIQAGWVSFENSLGRTIVTINPETNLLSSTLYTVLLSSTIEDLNGNPMGSSYEWKFRTAAEVLTWTQTTITDFESGSREGIVIMEDGNGELSLNPILYDRFLGSSLGSQWASGLWPGGAYSPAIGAGVLTHSNPGAGAYVRSADSFQPGITVNSRLKFSKGVNLTAPNLYFGLASTDLVPWALFGTGYTGDQMYASVYNSRVGDPAIFPLGTGLFDSWHDYTISWQASQVQFWVDGDLKFTETVSMPGPIYTYFSASNATPAGATVSADWVRVENYETKQWVKTPIIADEFTQADGPATNWESITNAMSSTGSWSVVNNQFVHGPAGSSYHPAVLNSTFPVLENFDLEVDAMSPDATGFLGLVWGLQDGSNFYFAQFYGSDLKVYKIIAWDGWTPIASSTITPFTANQWVKFRLEVRSGLHRIYLNDGLLVEFTDNYYPYGKAGVLGYGGNTSVYDNVIIDSWSEPLVMPEPGYYTSPVFDAGSLKNWHISWVNQVPEGTSQSFSARTGNTPIPDETWTDFLPIAASNDLLGSSSQYIQYQVDFITTDIALSPILESVTITASETPTAVEIANFAAQRVGDTIRLSWDTATEIDLIGFNIYRSEGSNPARVLLNASLLQPLSPGSTDGNSYSFIDDTAQKGVMYTYWLEGIDSSGSEDFGPLQIGIFDVFMPITIR